MRVRSRLVLAAALLVLPALSAAQAPAGAQGSHAAQVVAITSAVAVPGTSIVRPPFSGTYKPTSLYAHYSSRYQQQCRLAIISFTISNSTPTAKVVTLHGSFFLKIPAGQKFGICSFGSGVRTVYFGIRNSTSTLAVHLS